VDDITPEDSARLKELREALVSEFQTNNQQTNKVAIKDVEELKPDALNTLRHIIKHSDNESLKAKVSMWAYDKMLTAQERNDADALSSLIGSMPRKENANSEA